MVILRKGYTQKRLHPKKATSKRLHPKKATLQKGYTPKRLHLKKASSIKRLLIFSSSCHIICSEKLNILRLFSNQRLHLCSFVKIGYFSNETATKYFELLQPSIFVPFHHKSLSDAN